MEEQLRRAADSLLGKYATLDVDAVRGEFDAEASATIHRILAIDDRLAGDDDFWRYVNCVVLLDLIRWRHPNDDSSGMPGRPHLGTGGKWEGMGKRLWFRAELSKVDGADPYEYAVRGGMDFWTSGLIRILYSCNRSVARALVRFQFFAAGAFARGQYRPQTLGLNAVRELYKRLRHFQAIVSMANLDDDAATRLIEDIAKDLSRDKSAI
jgi:hypothetical protein